MNENIDIYCPSLTVFIVFLNCKKVKIKIKDIRRQMKAKIKGKL
jgi:hypothetical protein